MEKNYLQKVLALAIFTVIYNVLEGAVSVWLGAQDETLTLFGFGADSLIEVVSGLGILQMVFRIFRDPNTARGKFEMRALRITGWGFYFLSVGLLAGAFFNVYEKHKPVTSNWGIIISVISIIVMTALYKSKIFYGKKLNSDPVIADGKCTLVCIYMSLVLLVSSSIFALTGFGWVDTLGAIGLAWFSYNEGKEAFEKAKGKECACEQCDK